MWTLDEGLAMVRDIQKDIRVFSYHVAIGGGVVNKGRSDHDLDLYFIPFSEQGPNAAAMLVYLHSKWGTAYNLGGPNIKPEDVHLAYPDEPTWKCGRFTFWPDHGRRIDIFIA